MISRTLGKTWSDFTTKLSEFYNKENNNEDNNDDNKDDNKEDNKDDETSSKIKYDPETYPRYKRFAILVDRRRKPLQDDEKEANTKDKMFFFEPSNDSNTIKTDHVAEIGFDLLQKCIIPRGDIKDAKNITPKTDVCGQLITFMFNVEAINEIKCYIVWNGQTMRFHGDHIGKILPNIFVENDENKNFANTQEAKGLEREFETIMDDRKFAKFY
eukprot:448937_1